MAAAAPEQAGRDMLSIECDVCILKDFQFQDISANLLSFKCFNHQVEEFHALLGELTSHPRSVIILLYRIPTWNPILTLSVSVGYCH